MKKSGAQSSTKSGSVSKKDSKSSKGKQTQGKGDSETVWVEPAKFSEDEEEDNEPEYEVEEIVGKKVKRGVIYYQVKWKGFTMDDATWEPEDNLDHAPLKIRAYENQLLSSGADSSAKDKKGKPEAPASASKANGKDSAVANKLSALASNNEAEGLLGKRSRDSLDKSEQEDKKKNKNSVENKKAVAATNGEQKEEKGTKKVDRRSLEEKSKVEEEAKKGEKAGDKGKKASMEEEKETDSKSKKMEEEKFEPTKTKKGEQAASTSQQEAQASGSDNKAAGEANQAGDNASGNRANKDEGISLSRIMQDDKLMEGSETEEPSINEHREAETPEPNKAKKNKQKEQGEYGSLEKDIPMKVIGIRPVKEENDLEVMVSWKPRENGIKPYNSKIMRLALLKKGHWMPLIEFYESKMKLESAPNFDPNLLPRCNQ